MARCAARTKGTGERCRRQAATGDEVCRQHRRLAAGQADPGEASAPAGPGAGGLYADCLAEDVREALARAVAAGLDQETALIRVLIRRALVEGRPDTQVAALVDCLVRLVKTQHVVSGKNAQQLDEAIAAALDAIAAEIGIAL